MSIREVTQSWCCSIYVLSPDPCGKIKLIRASLWPGGVDIKREKLKNSPVCQDLKTISGHQWNKMAHTSMPREIHSGLNPVAWEIFKEKAELKHQEKLCAHKFSQGHFGFRLWSNSMLR